MGITGLLPFLDKASERINIKSLANKSVAIDSYCWLHKGAFGVGDKLVRGEATDAHILYCLKYVNMLLSHNIKPILVFDGRHLPAKAETESKRREQRKIAKQRAVELMRKGNHNEASKYLRRCVDITHEMALRLIQCCRELNVDCVVAPYEADAQLAYLNKIGLADYVITEDSDLTLFGCRKILFKLDLNGNCTLVDADKFHLAMDCRRDKFSMDKFRLMCVLSGCDYCDSLPGIGLAKACKFVMKTEEENLMRALDKIPAYLNMRQLNVTEEYKMNVIKAIATFLHMVVFDPRRRKQVHLNEISELGTDIRYCCNAGEILEGEEQQLNLAVGNLNPFTMTKLDKWHPDQRGKSQAVSKNIIKGIKPANHPSIWHRDYHRSILQATSFSSQTKTVITRRKSKRSIKETAVCDEDEEKFPNDGEIDENLLNEYAQIETAPNKRFKEDIEDSSDDEEMKKHDGEMPSPSRKEISSRNPFKKTVESTNELSLYSTQITKENNSLIKNQSPVKKIDFKRLEKLSRFNRTVVTAKQDVLSKFFNNAAKDSKPQGADGCDEGEESKSAKKTESIEIIQPEMAVCIQYTRSADSAISESSTKTDENVEESSDTISILQKFEYNYNRLIQDKEKADANGLIPDSQGSKSKTDSDLSDVPIMISDESNDVESDSAVSSDTHTSSHSSWVTSSQKSNQSCRNVGLKRKKMPAKSAIKSNSNSSKQSRLSMFGFQAKPQIQP